MLKRLRAATLTVVLLASLLFGAFQPAEAAGAEGLQCSVRSTGDQFLVGWSGATTTPDRFVVERRAFGNVHWRGRTGGSESSFTDGAAPSGSSSLTYWVKALDGRGRLLERAECSSGSGQQHCWSSAADGPGIQVWWDSKAYGDDIDIVIRRAVKPGQVPWWRAKVASSAESGSFYDRTSPTGWAQYQIVTKRDGRVVAVDDCAPSVCRSVARSDAPSAEDISRVVPNRHPISVAIPAGSGLNKYGNAKGVMDGHGGLWFVALDEQETVTLVRQDIETGEIVRGPKYFDDDIPSLLATQRRVLTRQQPKNSYGWTSSVEFNENNGTIEVARLAEGSSVIVESAEGALFVEGGFQGETGLQYVPAGSNDGVWVEESNQRAQSWVDRFTIGTNNRVFYQKNGEWFVADMSCHA